MRIAVCAPQVPFARGGAEIFAETLVDELRRRDHTADLVTVPFKWYPGAKVLSQAFLWRLVDLEEADGNPIDLVVATKFPAYCVRHPRKVAWVLHQFRQAYDYDRTELGQFSEEPEDRATRRAIDRLDRTCLAECRHVFATSQNVASRLARYSDVEAEILPHPPARLDYRTVAYDPFILSVNRLDRAKRIDLLIEAAKADPAVRVVIAGDGPDRPRLEQLAASLNGRVDIRGRVSDDELVDLYARCRAVYYAPIDEDFGMVPFEAFLAEKPVLTTTDAGGPLEVVSDRETGLVTEPEAAAIARACSELTADEDAARTWGRAGKAIAERVTWDRAIDRLLAVA
jgi:glycosyltransferase involved in cell wall biosynthesis